MGYVNNEKSADAVYQAVGPTFVTTGSSDAVVTLRDVKPGDGYDWDNDYLFVVNPEDCSSDADLAYYTKAEFGMLPEDGWYDSMTLDPYNDEEFPIGTGFQTSFSSGEAFGITSAGQVFEDGYSITTGGDIVYMFPVNATARTITFAEIVPGDGYDWDNDYLFIVNPEDCSSDADLAYYTKAEFGMLPEDGWYDSVTLDPYNEEEINPGQGFQTSFSGGVEFLLNFPPSVEK